MEGENVHLPMIGKHRRSRASPRCRGAPVAIVRYYQIVKKTAVQKRA